MFRFKLHYCKKRMVAYLNNELSPASRRRVARYIDECADCYAEYARQRRLQNELSAELGRFGRPNHDQLHRIWAAIGSELNGSDRGQDDRLPNALLMFTVGVILAFLVPLMWADGSSNPTAATQPMPQGIVISTRVTESPVSFTHHAVAQPRRIALTRSTEAFIIPEAAPQRTPVMAPR